MQQTECDYQYLFEELAGNSLILSTSLFIVAATNSYLKAHRLLREEVMGKPFSEILPRIAYGHDYESRWQIIRTLENLVSSGSAFDNDNVNVNVNAGALWKVDASEPVAEQWEISNTLLSDANGKTVFVVHRAQRFPILGSNSVVGTRIPVDTFDPQVVGVPDSGSFPQDPQFRLPIDALPIGIWLLDEKGTIIYGNEFADKIWGGRKYVGREKYAEYKAWWLSSGNPVQPHELAAVRALENGRSVLNDELKIQRFDGGCRIIRNSAIPLLDSTGRVTGAMVVNEDITDQKLKDETLSASEKRFKAIFENSMDAILVTSPNGRVAMINSMTSQLFGYSESEFIKLGRDAVVDTSDPQLLNALEERKRTGRYRGELTFVKKDGTKFPVEISSAIFKDEKGEDWTSMFIRDISDRKKVEQERASLLKHVEEKKRWIEAVIDRAPVGILLVKGDIEDSIVPNSNAKSLFGDNIDWSSGRKSVLGIVCQSDTTIPLKFEELATSKAFEGEITTAKEHQLCFPDGRKIPVLISSGPIKDSEDNIIGVVTVFQDISTQKKVEIELELAIRQLNTEKRWLQAVFEGSPLGILMLRQNDPEHPVPNAYVRSVFGDTVDWSIGRDSYLGIICTPEGRPITKNELVSSRVMNGETIVAEEQLIKMRDGRQIPVVAAGGPIHDEHGKQIGAVAFFQDITPLKDLEKLREEWAAIIAHDLRQPITSIQLHAGLLKLLPWADEKLIHTGELIESSARQLSRMTQDLLDASQLEANKIKIDPKEIDAALIIHQVVEKLQPLFPKNVIRADIQEKLPLLLIDPDRFQQVLGNLISNASKYGYPCTDIIIGVKQIHAVVSISVTNKGKGIPTEELGHLFQRFHRASTVKKEKIKGIGLGLYITKGLVEAHGGRIKVESTPGGKTTFIIELPAYKN
jgi:PAS domain S-box-containing protein